MRQLGLLCLLVLVLSSAAASENWEEACAKEGGCILVTQRAYDALLGELSRLYRLVHRGTCA